MFEKIRIFCKGVIHQLKNSDFPNALASKQSCFMKNGYNIRNLRKKLYLKTSFAQVSKKIIAVCQGVYKPIFSLFGKLTQAKYVVLNVAAQ